MDHAFGASGGFTLGIEEELLLVDESTRALAPVAGRVLGAMELPADAAAHEVYASELELRSPICPDVGAAVAALAEGRAAARAAGATLLGAGLHPGAPPGEAELVDAPRYRRVAGAMRGLIRRTPECALHVHVGMPDPETAVRALNGLRRHLPLLLALGANSPWWFGVDSGFASARWAMVRPYPGRGVPRAFRDFEDYVGAVTAATAAGDLEDYSFLWWDVRLHPRLGTVELREIDAQSRLDDVAAIGALTHALARRAAEYGRASEAHVPAEALAWSAFRAARDGLDATIHERDGLRPLRDVAREAVALVRPDARELGTEGALEGIERLLREGGGAGRQRAAHASGGMSALLDHLVDETSRPLADG